MWELGEVQEEAPCWRWDDSLLSQNQPQMKSLAHFQRFIQKEGGIYATGKWDVTIPCGEITTGVWNWWRNAHECKVNIGLFKAFLWSSAKMQLEISM